MAKTRMVRRSAYACRLGWLKYSFELLPSLVDPDPQLFHARFLPGTGEPDFSRAVDLSRV
jgi:hypothetical protein